MQQLNEKTVFVMDHTQYFSLSCEDYIDVDFLRGKVDGTIPESSQQFSKSLWTCAVEAALEYCRIVWDVFPRGKLVRLIVSDTAAHIVNTWNVATQNMPHVLNAMALVGVPSHGNHADDYSVIHGLRGAVEALIEPTELQLELLEKGISCNQLGNKGRVVCITSIRDNTTLKRLEDIFYTVLTQHNAIAATQKKMLSVLHCDLVLINVVPKNISSLVTDHQKIQISSNLTIEAHTISAVNISKKLTHLIMGHYDLASTTVTGIPMKEEQNANSSANYDVEILHSRNSHISVCGNEILLPTSIKEGAEYETVTLKWCTPRGSGSSDMQPCLAQHRVTPVDVTSRPSACLINFLLNGRSVLLEMPRKTGGKITSHVLSARGGEIFIHSLQITRSCLDDPLSILEGPGGRITDYRISDYAAFIKAHRFVPLKPKTRPEDNLFRVREKFYRHSRYFPLTLSTSLIYNLQRNLNWLSFFLHKIQREDMDKTDEVQCQQNIFEMYSAATRGDSLPLSNIGIGRIKTNKKTEQYKLFCHELEVMIRSYASTPHHRVILENVQNVRSAFGGDSNVKADIEVGARDYNTKNIIRATTDSPSSPTHNTEAVGSILKATKRTISNSSHRSLLDIVASAEKSQSFKRVDFTGRLCTPVGQIAKLYPEFGTKEKDGNSTPSSTNIKEETSITTKLEVAIRN